MVRGDYIADQLWRMVKSGRVNQADSEIAGDAPADGVAGSAGCMDHGVIGINGSAAGQANLLVVTPVTGRGIANRVGVVMGLMAQAKVEAVAAEAVGGGQIEVWYFICAMARGIAGHHEGASVRGEVKPFLQAAIDLVAAGAGVMDPRIIKPGINSCTNAGTVGGVVGAGGRIRHVALNAAVDNIRIGSSGEGVGDDGGMVRRLGEWGGSHAGALVTLGA